MSPNTLFSSTVVAIDDMCMDNYIEHPSVGIDRRLAATMTMGDRISECRTIYIHGYTVHHCESSSTSLHSGLCIKHSFCLFVSSQATHNDVNIHKSSNHLDHLHRHRRPCRRLEQSCLLASRACTLVWILVKPLDPPWSTIVPSNNPPIANLIYRQWIYAFNLYLTKGQKQKSRSGY